MNDDFNDDFWRDMDAAIAAGKTTRLTGLSDAKIWEKLNRDNGSYWPYQGNFRDDGRDDLGIGDGA